MRHVEYPNIKAEMEKAGMLMADMEECVGMSPKTIGGWINHGGAFPVWALLKMADMFSVSCDYLLGREEK